MGDDEPGPGWLALATGLRAVSHLANALTPGMSGPDQVVRLQDARHAFEQALEQLEAAIIEAEGSEIPGSGNGGDQ